MPDPKRKLAAIVFTDIVGFTELSAKNEPAALDLLEKQRTLLKPIVIDNNGEWLKEIGDGLLLSFETTIDAVQCSIAIQNASKGVEGLELRIGVHQGEVVFQGEDIVGDDVNIASRIEPYAAAGGIAISGRVNASLERNPDFDTVFIGSPSLKGVSQEVKIFSITSHGLKVSDKIVTDTEVEPKGFKWNVFSVTGAVLTVLGILFWVNVSFLSLGESSESTIPSIVILPFENKGESKDEFYSYGISADLISDITSVGQLRVASLNSVEEMIDNGMKDIEIANELSSRYVVSGSLWKIDSIFQLSIELFDTKKEMLVLSQRWETGWSDLSMVKSDLTEKIINGLGIDIINELDKKYDVNSTAYELYLKSKHTFNNRKTTQDVQVARDLLDKAIALDSNFVDAKYLLASTYQDNDRSKAISLYQNALAVAEKYDNKQIKLQIKRDLGYIYSRKWEVEEARSLFKEAYKISKEIGNESNIAGSLNGLGGFFWELRQGDSAKYYWKKSYEIVKKLDDKEMLASILNNLGLVHWVFDNDIDRAILDFEEAINNFGSSISSKNITPYSNLGIIYHNKGQYEKSKTYYDQVLDMATSINNKRSIGFIKYWIGLHYYELFDVPTALDYFQSSYEINTELGVERWKGNSLGGVILCHKILGDEEMVDFYFEKAEEINKNIVNDLYLYYGFMLMILDSYDLARKAFLRQLDYEKNKNNDPGIINTLTNIGLSYYLEGSFSDAMTYFKKSTDYKGVDSLFNPIETLLFDNLSRRNLGLPEQDTTYLLSKIQENNNKDENWYKNLSPYFNLGLYEFFGDKKYIIDAHNKIQNRIKLMAPENAEKYLSFSIRRKIANINKKNNNI